MPTRTRTDKDDELVARLKAGDETAVGVLDAAYSVKVRSLASRFIRNREDIDEIAQDVFLRVARNVGRFREDATLSSWIYRITFNVAMDKLRRRRRDARILSDADPLPRENDDGTAGPATLGAIDWVVPDESLMRNRFVEVFYEALDDLPVCWRDVVVSHYVYGDTIPEIAERLGANQNTVKSRLYRGRALLAARLGDYRGGFAIHPRWVS